LSGVTMVLLANGKRVLVIRRKQRHRSTEAHQLLAGKLRSKARGKAKQTPPAAASRRSSRLLEEARAANKRLDYEAAVAAYELGLEGSAEVAARLEFAKMLRCWAASPADLENVEDQLRQTFVESKQQGDEDTARQALELLVLLITGGDSMHGESREGDQEVWNLLKLGGFKVKLHRDILCYAHAGSGVPAIGSEAYVRVVDDALTQPMVAHLEALFGVDSGFWTDHSYHTAGDACPYFSYVHDLNRLGETSLGQIIRRIRRAAIRLFPGVARARYAEWWAHCRPHASGHQLHFDSDDEGRGGLRHPIISSVVALTSGVGGPTLVTDQRLADGKLASKGWLVHPHRNRLVCFDGSVLHGVIPGRGVRPVKARRVTWMVAFWEDIKMRTPTDGIGCAAMALPAQDDPKHARWAPTLAPVPQFEEEVPDAPEAPNTVPIVLPSVWETVTAPGAPPGALPTKLPPYEVCYQGW